MNKKHHFFGLLSRMRLIKRWSLMRNLNSENIAEHSYDVAIIAHNLAWLRKLRFADQYSCCPDPGKVMQLAVFHDAPEIITGDLPTPVKYYDQNLRQSFACLEEQAIARLISLLPLDLQPIYADLLRPDRATQEINQALLLVKAADKLSAYLKCLQETQQGNSEFAPALATTLAAIHALKLPEAECFLTEFAPSYVLPLDELQPVAETAEGPATVQPREQPAAQPPERQTAQSTEQPAAHPINLVKDNCNDHQ